MLAWGALLRRTRDGGGWNACPGPECSFKEAVPEHLDRTSAVAGPSVMCLVPVRSGAVVGGHLGGGGTAEVCAHRGPYGENGARSRTVGGPSGTPTANPNHTSAAVALLYTTNERG